MPSNDGETGESRDAGENTAFGETGALFDALGDELSRRILVEATPEIVTASSLADLFDVAPATVYRRLNRLSDLGMIREVTDVREVPTSETGYRTDLQTLVLVLSSGELEVMQASSELRAALKLILDELDVNEASFDFEDSTATVTLSMDDGTLHELHDCYHTLTQRERPSARLSTE